MRAAGLFDLTGRRAVVTGGNSGVGEAMARALGLAGARVLLVARREKISAGGVDLREVHPVTMESRLVPGLFFAGELLDLDGDTGGFNLQAAFTTGHLAGKAAAA